MENKNILNKNLREKLNPFCNLNLLQLKWKSFFFKYYKIQKTFFKQKKTYQKKFFFLKSFCFLIRFCKSELLYILEKNNEKNRKKKVFLIIEIENCILNTIKLYFF